MKLQRIILKQSEMLVCLNLDSHPHILIITMFEKFIWKCNTNTNVFKIKFQVNWFSKNVIQYLKFCYIFLGFDTFIFTILKIYLRPY